MIPTAPGILEILVQASEGRRARPPPTSTGPGSRRCVPRVLPCRQQARQPVSTAEAGSTRPDRMHCEVGGACLGSRAPTAEREGQGGTVSRGRTEEEGRRGATAEASTIPRGRTVVGDMFH